MKHLFLAGCLLASVMASAQTVRDTSNISEIERAQVIDIRANNKTPVAFTNISKTHIQKMNFGLDMPFLLNFTPSALATSDTGTGIGYTGLRVRGTDATRINVTSNGIPMNDAESSMLYWVNIGDFASNVQNVQLQRGVGTSTNGAGAFGATLNMQTNALSTTPFATLDISGGSFGTHKETFSFGSGLLGGHWAFDGRLSNIGTDGYIDRASGKLNSYFLQGGYVGDNTIVKFITFNGTEKTYMAWDYTSKADMEKYGRTYNPSGKYTTTEGETAFYNNQTDNYHQQHYQLHWTQRLNPMLNLNAALHYTKGDGYYEQYKTDQKLYKYHIEAESGEKSDLVRQKKMENDFGGIVASLNFNDKKRLSANIGGAWNIYDGDHFGNVIWVRNSINNLNPNQRYYDNNARKTDGNVYAKANYEIITGLNAYLDLQYRHVDLKMKGSSQEFSNGVQVPFDIKKNYDFFNPKFGMLYKINPANTVYASYGISHKEPTRNDFENEVSTSQPIQPKAERLNDLEVGYRFAKKRFLFAANFYYMDYDNQFVLTGAQDANGEMVAANIKNSYRTGLELQAVWYPFDGFVWQANATWSRNRAKNMHLKVVDENWNESYVNVGTTHLSFSPNFIFNNILSYQYKGFFAALMTKYVSEQYMTNSNFRAYTDIDGNRISAMLDSYFTSDLYLSYTFKLKGLKGITAGVTVYNLFNEKYESNGSCGMYFRNNNGAISAFGNYDFWAWSTYSAQAPTNFLAHISFKF